MVGQSEQFSNLAELLGGVTDPELLALIWSIARASNKEVKFLGVDKLSDEMQEETRRSYEDDIGISLIESFKVDNILRSESEYLVALLDSMRLKFSGKTVEVLVLGSELGLDVFKLMSNGLLSCNVDAVDYSELMSRYCDTLVFSGTASKTHTTNLLDFSPPALNHYHGILVESAFQHLNKEQVLLMLEHFHSWLKPGATLLFRLKLSDTGQVYQITDGVGSRYYTSWTVQELTQLIAWLDKLGYEVVSHQQIAHKDSQLQTPPFYQFLVRKKDILT